MADASNISREERRIRQFKSHLEDQIFNILGNPRPDRQAIDTALKTLAIDVVLIGYYGDKLESITAPLHDACKEISQSLTKTRLSLLEKVNWSHRKKFGFELQKLLEGLPF